MVNVPLGARLARVLLAVVMVAGALAGAGVRPQPVAAAPVSTSDSGSGSYVVLLSDAPAASYRGGDRGHAGTASAYPTFLRRQQDRVAGSVGAEPFYHYTTSVNGFAARLTAAQAGALARRDGVVAVVPDQVRRVQAVQAPAPAAGVPGMRLPATGARPGGPTGAGVVIGVVDTGIDSDSRSFAPVGRPAPRTYRGSCVTGTDTDPAAAFTCSDKVVGGGYFARGQGGPGAVWSAEYLSPEDYSGHGTRIASVAAGTARARVSTRGVDLGRVAGAAPGARVASYKVCWSGEEGMDSCLTSDALAGVDQAVADGVDVISYGIEGAPGDLADPVALAFLHAADAGVFVATVAGNGGPRRGTSDHPSPWTTTVGAAVQDTHAATVVLGNGERYRGVSLTPDDLAAKPLVLGREAAAPGIDTADAQRCFPGSLSPGAVAGAVVVCDRGTNDRVEKSAVVQRAGGAGMVLLNPTAGSTDADLHGVPTVHLPETAYDGIYAYAEGADAATAALRAGAGPSVPAPARAGFSGRGPTRVAGGDLLKPDLVAPGVGVLTAAAGERGAGGPAGRYALSSGTSVAAGYVAGLAAQLRQAHPGWSPMAVKSALMTTASDLTDGDNPFVQGAGFVRPARALDPGLVFDSRRSDWSSLLAAQGFRDGTGAAPVPASGLNAASLVVGELAGRQSVRRTVTNVDDATATYSVSASGFDGISVTAAPSVFTLRPGQRQALTLRVVRDNAELGTYQTGEVLLNDGPGGHRVRIPVALRPVGVRAPGQVRLDSTRRTLSTRSGIRGTLTARVRGPVAAVDTTANGADTSGADFDPGMPGLWSQTVDVAGPGEWLRVQTLAGDPDDDLDLFLLDEQGRVVASAAGDDAAETVTVHGLAAGTYRIAVQPWFVADPSGRTTFRVRTFQVPPRPSDALTVEPRHQGASPARANTWSLRLAAPRAGSPRFGWIGWYAADDLVGRTLVSSD